MRALLIRKGLKLTRWHFPFEMSLRALLIRKDDNLCDPCGFTRVRLRAYNSGHKVVWRCREISRTLDRRRHLAVVL